MHSRRRISVGMSKCDFPSSSIARSLVSCIHFFRASVPCSLRAGSPSRKAMASWTLAPGLISLAMASCSATMRLSSSMPHS